MISRRALLATTALALPVVALAACNAAQVAQVLPQYAQDAQTIAAGLQASLTQLKSNPALPAAVLTRIGGYVTDMQQVAAAIAASATASAALPAVQQLEADFNSVVSAAAGLGAIIPPPFGTALQAAAVLLPIVETAVGMVVNAVGTPPTGAALSPDQARALLKAAAGG